jgi:hypothetical protein
MQTFLAYPSFTESMHVLDDSRLGNQVYREGMTLLRGGWPNHPASKMWRGYEGALANYLMAGVHELYRRGKDYHDRPWCQELFSYAVGSDMLSLPPWLGDPDFHASHRSNLLRKDPVWYGQFGWTEPDNLEYIWPE